MKQAGQSLHSFDDILRNAGQIAPFDTQDPVGPDGPQAAQDGVVVDLVGPTVAGHAAQKPVVGVGSYHASGGNLGGGAQPQLGGNVDCSSLSDQVVNRTSWSRRGSCRPKQYTRPLAQAVQPLGDSPATILHLSNDFPGALGFANALAECLDAGFHFVDAVDRFVAVDRQAGVFQQLDEIEGVVRCDADKVRSQPDDPLRVSFAQAGHGLGITFRDAGDFRIVHETGYTDDALHGHQVQEYLVRGQ